MPHSFQTIGLIGKRHAEEIVNTLLQLKDFLLAKQHSVLIDAETSHFLPELTSVTTVNRDTLGQMADLIIVVGGDGSLLDAARVAVSHHTPILGINRGRLGFLTDIYPHEIETKVGAVLEGNYLEEQRFLLTAQIDSQPMMQQDALNDIVLMPGETPHMIEFAIYIQDQFVCNQRADGLIVATPTGSTAYALSGGGPILHPELEAITLVPMFPHTLSMRPIVISADNTIRIEISEHNTSIPRLSCDGRVYLPVPPGSSININKKSEKLRLIHPQDYHYFETLRNKLHWGKEITC